MELHCVTLNDRDALKFGKNRHDTCQSQRNSDPYNGVERKTTVPVSLKLKNRGHHRICNAMLRRTNQADRKAYNI